MGQHMRKMDKAHTSGRDLYLDWAQHGADEDSSDVLATLSSQDSMRSLRFCMEFRHVLGSASEHVTLLEDDDIATRFLF